MIGKHNNMLAVIADGIGTLGIDDNRAIMTKLLLESRMTVIPVGT